MTTVEEAKARLDAARIAEREAAAVLDAARKAAREERRRQEAARVADLATTLHRDELPALTDEQASKVFAMAWDRGHSSGYEAVTDEYRELAEMIRTIR